MRAGAAHITTVGMRAKPTEFAAAVGADLLFEAVGTEVISAGEVDIVIDSSGDFLGLSWPVMGRQRRRARRACHHGRIAAVRDTTGCHIDGDPPRT